MQAYDHGGKARAVATMLQAMAQAKEADLDPATVKDALQFIDWADLEDRAGCTLRRPCRAASGIRRRVPGTDMLKPRHGAALRILQGAAQPGIA